MDDQWHIMNVSKTNNNHNDQKKKKNNTHTYTQLNWTLSIDYNLLISFYEKDTIFFLLTMKRVYFTAWY